MSHEALLGRVLAPFRCGGVHVVLVGPELESRLLHAAEPRWIPGGANTWEEAQRVIHAGIPEFTIVTSQYHALRAFLTFLAAAGRDRQVVIWNDPAPSSMLLLPIELEKIGRYRVMGHCASFEAGRQYLDWRDARDAA